MLLDACDGCLVCRPLLSAQDLGAADPYMAFPVMTGVMMMAMAELGGEGGAMAGSSTKMKAGMRGMALLVTPFTMHISTGVFVYWTTSNFYSILQTLAFKVGEAEQACAREEGGGESTSCPLRRAYVVLIVQIPSRQRGRGR